MKVILQKLNGQSTSSFDMPIDHLTLEPGMSLDISGEPNRYEFIEMVEDVAWFLENASWATTPMRVGR